MQSYQDYAATASKKGPDRPPRPAEPSWLARLNVFFPVAGLLAFAMVRSPLGALYRPVALVVLVVVAFGVPIWLWRAGRLLPRIAPQHARRYRVGHAFALAANLSLATFIGALALLPSDSWTWLQILFLGGPVLVVGYIVGPICIYTARDDGHGPPAGPSA
jgi:hypothetical protein